MNNARRLFTSVGTGAFAALCGLVLTLTAAVFAWSIFRGIPGVLFAMVIGAVIAFAIRKATTLPASPVAGAVGSMVGAFLSIASAEELEPGSLDWALKGGLYGVMVGVPIGAGCH